MATVLITIACLNILVNLCIVVFLSVKDLIASGKQKYRDCKKDYYKKKKLKNHKLLANNMPEDFPDIVSNIEELEAIKFCKAWRVKRLWLIYNNIDLKDFAEEE